MVERGGWGQEIWLPATLAADSRPLDSAVPIYYLPAQGTGARPLGGQGGARPLLGSKPHTAGRLLFRPTTVSQVLNGVCQLTKSCACKTP